MPCVNFNRHLVTAAVVLERLDGVAVPAMLGSHVVALRAARASLERDAITAAAALALRTARADAITGADDALGSSFEVLGAALVVAGLASLRAPFAPFGGRAVSHYTRGSRVRVAREIAQVVANIRDTAPPTDVERALAVCALRCDAVIAAYGALGVERARFRTCERARNASCDALVAAISDVKNIAKVAWRAEPRTFAIVFAAIERDRFGTRVAAASTRARCLGDATRSRFRALPAG